MPKKNENSKIIEQVKPLAPADVRPQNQYKIELLDCTNTLLREIEIKEAKRRDIAQTYRLAMESSETVNWRKVNIAIIKRWSRSGLKWIKRQAWSVKCFAV